jgi:hypothetical protein
LYLLGIASDLYPHFGRKSTAWGKTFDKTLGIGEAKEFEVKTLRLDFTKQSAIHRTHHYGRLSQSAINFLIHANIFFHQYFATIRLEMYIIRLLGDGHLVSID